MKCLALWFVLANFALALPGFGDDNPDGLTPTYDVPVAMTPKSGRPLPKAGDQGLPPGVAIIASQHGFNPAMATPDPSG